MDRFSVTGNLLNREVLRETKGIFGICIYWATSLAEKIFGFAENPRLADKSRFRAQIWGFRTRFWKIDLGVNLVQDWVLSHPVLKFFKNFEIWRNFIIHQLFTRKRAKMGHLSPPRRLVRQQYALHFWIRHKFFQLVGHKAFLNFDV